MSSFSNDAFLQRMKAVAQNRPTITPVPSCKRPRHARDGTSSPGPSEDERDENKGSIPLAGLNLAHSRPATQNAANAVKSFAKKQKLRGEQLTQVDTFLNDTPTVREGKIFSLLLSLQNDVGNIIVAAPAFSVSPGLQTNIKSYAIAVMLSPKLAQYCGDLPVQHVINILKKHRFDMPPGIENNPADMQKITAAVQYAFTQDQSSLKKKLFASVRVSRVNEAGTRVTVDLPPCQHQNLFGLAQAFVDGTKCRITNALCGRIALMVCHSAVFLPSFLTGVAHIEGHLSSEQQRILLMDGNDEACDAMFEDLIIVDKNLHGAVDIVYQATNNIQQEVDDLIVAGRGREDAGTTDLPTDPTTDLEANGVQGEGGGAEPAEEAP
ncbi:hypothetical protein DFH08DRAFT_967760 [Mycena albidolilacea]|uniref:Uncharacterized protein n=1 Tax=Mycena albidolilacea TaxID=1033008 RepID=A0AAD6ZL31_9AGAR|nr:hypothetical protein DFH08DRAFT_967760 [Mycena albidolilacea]